MCSESVACFGISYVLRLIFVENTILTCLGHEESFKDVPRLSTIQGMILVLKAREAVPRRGYYYRSWMTIQYLVSMSKDLALDDHSRMQGTSFRASSGRRKSNLFESRDHVRNPSG